jgi:hypothetical protein
MKTSVGHIFFFALQSITVRQALTIGPGPVYFMCCPHLLPPPLPPPSPRDINPWRAIYLENGWGPRHSNTNPACFCPRMRARMRDYDLYQMDNV